MRFLDPSLLTLLVLLVPLALLIRLRMARSPAHPITDGAVLALLPKTWRSSAGYLLPYLRLLVLSLLIISLARPQVVIRETTQLTKTVDLIIALDISSSMLAEDAHPGKERKNRLTAAKEVLGDFLHKRSGDRMGLVVFAARAYSAAPLTMDHAWLQAAVERLQIGNIEDGTALGDGLLAALNRLRKTPVQSGAVILVTDGRSNTGTSPAQAAEAAAAMGIRVHTVGIGSIGTALFPVEDPLGGINYRQLRADLDETALRMIADTTGGSYFRAGDQRSLTRVFQEIDKLEKQPIAEKVYFSSRELFTGFLLIALLLMLAEQLLCRTLLRRLP